MKRYAIVGGLGALVVFVGLWAAFLQYMVHWGPPQTTMEITACTSTALVPAPEKGYNKKKTICVDPYTFEVGTLTYEFHLGTTPVKAYHFGTKPDQFLVMVKPDSTVVVAGLPRVALP